MVDGVFVNGHGPYRFLVDTGAETNQIDAALARSIGLEPAFQVELVTAAGTVRVPGGRGIEVSLDSARSDGQEFLYTDLRGVKQLASDIRGVLGESFLARFDYLLDLRGKRLVFGKLDREGTRAEFRMVEGRPSIFTSLGRMVLDSGSDRIVLFGAARRMGTSTLYAASGFRETGSVQAKPLVIEGRTIRHDDAVGVPRQAGVAEDGLLPSSLFRAVYVCNSERYVVLD